MIFVRRVCILLLNFEAIVLHVILKLVCSCETRARAHENVDSACAVVVHQADRVGICVASKSGAFAWAGEDLFALPSDVVFFLFFRFFVFIGSSA